MLPDACDAERFKPHTPIDGFPLFKPPYGRITAIDMSTGKHVWMVANGEGPRDLPAGTTGAPMTYLHKGKQSVVVAIGGRDHAAEWVAFSLPSPGVNR